MVSWKNEKKKMVLISRLSRAVQESNNVETDLGWHICTDSRVRDCGISVLFKALALILQPSVWYDTCSGYMWCISVATCGAFRFFQCVIWFVKLPISSFVIRWISMKYGLFWAIYSARKPADWMMIRTFTSYSRWNLMKMVPRILCVIHMLE